MIKYIKEFKNRLLLLLFCWLSTFIITYYYKEIFLFEILKSTLSQTSVLLNNFMFTNVTELFSTYFDLTIFISNQVLITYSFYNLIAFLAPGLYYYEYKILKNLYHMVIVFWWASLICLNEFLAKFLWNFFLSFQEDLTQKKISIKFEAKISEYLSFFKNLYYYTNLQFQFFIVLILVLNYFGNTKEKLKKFRKVFYFLFLLIATFLTPPDVCSQLIVCFSLVFVLEFIVLIRLFLIN